jgi:hypothetical protein
MKSLTEILRRPHYAMCIREKAITFGLIRLEALRLRESKGEKEEVDRLDHRIGERGHGEWQALFPQFPATLEVGRRPAFWSRPA